MITDQWIFEAGRPMCAQSISVLYIITFTDYSSENITILCASLVFGQREKYSVYVRPFAGSAFIKG